MVEILSQIPATTLACRSNQLGKAAKYAGLYWRACRNWGAMIKVTSTQGFKFLGCFHPSDRAFKNRVDTVADVNQCFFHPLDVEQRIEGRGLPRKFFGEAP